MSSRLAALAALALLAGGCSTGHEPAVRATAQQWADSVASHDWGAACDLLASPTREQLEQSEQQPCPPALAEEGPSGDLGEGTVRVYGTQAQVSYRDETLFLSRVGGSWRVRAASCSPPRGRDDRFPHDCTISGG